MCVIVCTIFPQLIVHPQLLLQCATIWVQMTLFLWLVVTVVHPCIVPHLKENHRNMSHAFYFGHGKAAGGPNVFLTNRTVNAVKMSEIVRHRKWSFDASFKLTVIQHAETSSNGQRI